MQDLTDAYESFIVIRGIEKIIDNRFRDIDCCIDQSDFESFIETYKYQIEEIKNIRNDALDVLFNLDDERFVLDFHFSLNVHGVNVDRLFNRSRHITKKDKIRCLDNVAELFHSLCISFFANRGKKTKLIESLSQKECSEINIYFPEKLLQNLYQSKINNFNFPFLFVSYFGLVSIVEWFSYFFKNLNKENDFRISHQVKKTNLKETLDSLNIFITTNLKIIFTKDDQLRFGIAEASPHEIYNFISLHNVKGILQYFLFKALTTLRLVSFKTYDKKFLQFKFKSRRLLLVFFGTNSIDKSLLLIYSKNKEKYLLKKSTKNNSTISEYKNLIAFKDLSSSFFVPKSKVAGQNLVQIFHKKKPYRLSSLLTSNNIKEYCKDQLSSSEKISFEDYFNKSLKNITFNNKSLQTRFNLLKKYVQKKYSLEEDCLLSWGHCDFTPWNLIKVNDNFFLIDFEKFKKNNVICGFDISQFFLSNLMFSNKKLTPKKLDNIRDYFMQKYKFKTSINFDISIVEVFKDYLYIIDQSEDYLIQYDWVLSIIDDFNQIQCR